MKKRLITLRMLSVLLFFMVSCTSLRRPSVQESFEFSSGGAYHPSGYGAWKINLQADGKLTIAHDVQGEVTDYGPYQITKGENQQIWQLIHQSGFNRLESSQRPGIPDEVKYTIVLKDSSGEHRVEMWVSDTLDDEHITVLVNQIASLIETYINEKPVLK